MANIGYQQVRNGKREEYGLITAGDDLVTIARFLDPGRTEYSAADVISQLLSGCDGPRVDEPRVDEQQILDPCDDVCFA
jgi:hypothetical protein